MLVELSGGDVIADGVKALSTVDWHSKIFYLIVIERNLKIEIVDENHRKFEGFQHFSDQGKGKLLTNR